MTPVIGVHDIFIKILDTYGAVYWGQVYWAVDLDLYKKCLSSGDPIALTV